MRALAVTRMIFLAAMSLSLSAQTIPLSQTLPPDSPHFFSSPADSAAPGSRTALSATAVLRGETPEIRLLRLRRQAFVEQMLGRAAVGVRDSTMAFRVSTTHLPAIGLTAEELARLGSQPDPVEDVIRRDQLGVPALFNLGEVLGQGVKYLAGKAGLGQPQPKPWSVIPTAAEVSVMKVLWQEGTATTAAIYARLDSLSLTVEDLETLLEDLSARGWVTRKLVSPQHEFTVFGLMTFEMSRKNARNREYLYTPLIPRQKMLAYLGATAYARRGRHAPGDELVAAHLRRLMILLTSEGPDGRN
ncbi:MAG: BlaI/MecI/CopY family transcriptional regulator [candidate division KSB1 bacterium]|nr:BlaI/MecI/CopY family transcriptional regulator [candidate division KSB1 bacterium]MDZ7272656.1 BlaI/MecI/CopY family transcriptional regulator [candidate division KSB1 bacterium]MDZ7284322.1 BlaI/MecI/CopY family transcriptional regulator [candidate division KSB1 bacterium]MDZ7297282.1 BlaI/MecI/CopY family transcriptional regulator [candidate division KSB1 bacterium]MDZ7309505.1 BlaI/MecI/CopY family transcriptional regulator [candidate division KSB1 bacterium]